MTFRTPVENKNQWEEKKQIYLQVRNEPDRSLHPLSYKWQNHNKFLVINMWKYIKLFFFQLPAAMNKMDFGVTFVSNIKKAMGSSNYLLPKDAASCIFLTSKDGTCSRKSEYKPSHPSYPFQVFLFLLFLLENRYKTRLFCSRNMLLFPSLNISVPYSDLVL